MPTLEPLWRFGDWFDVRVDIGWMVRVRRLLFTRLRQTGQCVWRNVWWFQRVWRGRVVAKFVRSVKRWVRYIWRNFNCVSFTFFLNSLFKSSLCKVRHRRKRECHMRITTDRECGCPVIHLSSMFGWIKFADCGACNRTHSENQKSDQRGRMSSQTRCRQHQKTTP